MAIANRRYTFYSSSFISLTFETLATKFHPPPLRNALGKSTPSSDLPSFSRPPNSIPNQDLKFFLLLETLVSRVASSSYFTLNGIPFLDSTTIPSSLIPPLFTLILRTRFLGGGGDGGATGADLATATSICTQRRNLIRSTLTRRGYPSEKKLLKGFGHIRGLKDMIKINLSVILGTESRGNAISEPQFQCSITGLEFDGKYKFFALRTCGHAPSSKALKEVKSSSCLVCHVEFTDRDKFVINGNEEEVEEIRERMEEEKLKSKEKKTKKVRNGEVGMNGDVSVDLAASHLSGKKHGIEVKALEKVSAKLERHEWPDGGVQVKVAASNGAVKRFKAADMVRANATKEVYASILTSSRKSNFKEAYSCRSLPLGRN
ncbi:unnamed protein product [Citrullus colocynthis]|uniref:Replication termination factor 2 n=1 Tax=Citrullus colocynthis TaxID=252529 RepID=A0ABP0ZGB5_9ROSI